MKRKKKPRAPRGQEALAAILHCKGGAMKHRLTPRGGSQPKRHDEGWEDDRPRHQRGQGRPDLSSFCGGSSAKSPSSIARIAAPARVRTPSLS